MKYSRRAARSRRHAFVFPIRLRDGKIFGDFAQSFCAAFGNEEDLPIYNVMAVVRGAVHAMAYRAYAIRPYIYTVCNQQPTYIVHIIPTPLKTIVFMKYPENNI